MFETLVTITAFLLGFWCGKSMGSLPALWAKITDFFTGKA